MTVSDTGVPLTTKERRLLASDEQVLYAARVIRAGHGHTRLERPLVLLTNRRFIASGKPRLFAAPTADIDIPWHRWSRIDGSPLDGDLMRIQLVAETTVGQVEVVAEPTVAYEIETRARREYRR